MAVGFHNWSIGRLCRTKRKRHAPCPIMKMSVNGVSMIFGFVSLVIRVVNGCGLS